jgi:hypothetical protein
MVFRRRPRVVTLLALLSLPLSLPLLLSLGGCAGANADASRPLPSYVGHATELFDDGIEPGAVGLDLEQVNNPRTDALLRERTQVSDAALRVRISTITEKQDGSESQFQLGVHPVETLGGPFPPKEDFIVTVRPRTASIGIVKSLENAIVGKSFVAFIRAFVLPDGDREVHFHFSPDTKALVAAVREATQKSSPPPPPPP